MKDGQNTRSSVIVRRQLDFESYRKATVYVGIEIIYYNNKGGRRDTAERSSVGRAIDCSVCILGMYLLGILGYQLVTGSIPVARSFTVYCNAYSHLTFYNAWLAHVVLLCGL